MATSGYLGLPLTFGQIPDFASQYYYDLISTHIGIEQRLELAAERYKSILSDPRVQELEGKLVRCGFTFSLFTAKHLIAWWSWRANLVGPEEANADLEAYLAESEIEFVAAAWLHGIEIAQSIQLAEDITLLHPSDLPNYPDKQIALQSRAFNLLRNSVPRCLLCRRVRLRKLPGIEEKHDFQSDVQQTFLDVGLIINAMPELHCSVGWRTGYMPDNVPLGMFGGMAGSSTISDVVLTLECQASQESFRDFPLIKERFDQLSSSWKTRVRGCLSRLGQAKGRTSNADKSLDLGIALEMVLLDSEHGGSELPGQLNAHFRARGAWLLGKDFEERQEIYALLGKIYSWRSQVAHTGGLAPSSVRSSSFNEDFNRALRLAERLVRKLIVEGPPNDWKQVTLGMHMESKEPPEANQSH